MFSSIEYYSKMVGVKHHGFYRESVSVTSGMQ